MKTKVPCPKCQAPLSDEGCPACTSVIPIYCRACGYCVSHGYCHSTETIQKLRKGKKGR